MPLDYVFIALTAILIIAIFEAFNNVLENNHGVLPPLFPE
jgi:hypothetical protein